MKVIYLDIDGVLNSYVEYQILENVFNTGGEIPSNIIFYDHANYIETNKLNRIHRIVRKYDARVVIVSSWVCKQRENIKICEFLDVPYHSDALCTSGGVYRGRGVKHHASMHNINDYIIIDDGDVMYEDTTHLIHIDGLVGITEDDLQRIDDKWSK